ncbi:hypothetical protein B0H14DRAFT_2646944 [Mycena olivaceomarginata]|nr:hypothetical protein B0H14DRAFT_2646944 [Mycena olivaceomarginata]
MSIGFDVEWTADNEPGAKRKTRGEHNAKKDSKPAQPANSHQVGASEAARFADILRGNESYLIDLPAISFQARISRGDETCALYCELVGLADIAEHVCGMKLDKSQRESDWSKAY